jgi:pyridoxal phosphate enzyme (YggS family)
MGKDLYQPAKPYGTDAKNIMSPLSTNDNIEAETINNRLAAIRTRIAAAEREYGRQPGSVTLLAVGKSQSADAIGALYAAGQRNFGESYLQEALSKQTALSNFAITWHFIGALQSNKTRQVAQHFAWVHSVDRLKIAVRLNEQRPEDMPPLNICLQVNIGAERQKAGIAPADLHSLAAQLRPLSRLRLRGLMALPPASNDVGAQRGHFRQLKLAFEQLRNDGHPLDTLSMGMSTDLEAAIAEGSTLVRIGTALFGERPYKP